MQTKPITEALQPWNNVQGPAFIFLGSQLQSKMYSFCTFTLNEELTVLHILCNRVFLEIYNKTKTLVFPLTTNDGFIFYLTLKC